MCASTSPLLPASDNAMQQALQADPNYVELQPGFSVCLTTPDSLDSYSNNKMSFVGDTKYIHLNCLLQGTFTARLKNIDLSYSAGDLNMGFSNGEVFHLQTAAKFCNLEIMVTPEALNNLAGEELAGLDFNKEMEFFVKNADPTQRCSASAMQVANLIKRTPNQQLLLHSAALDFLYWHLKSFQVNNNTSISLRERKQLEAAKELLLVDLSSPPTIAELALGVGLNQCKLKKGYKILFGSSIYAHFQYERMKQAKQLLKNNNVTETAVTLGYSNISHFSSAFRKQFGVLPREARRDILELVS